MLSALGFLGVPGQAGGSWGCAKGWLALRAVSPALCPSSHTNLQLHVVPFPSDCGVEMSGSIQSPSGITLVSPEGALQRQKLRHREAVEISGEDCGFCDSLMDG